MTGIELALNKKDSLITSYRDHCQHISRGGSVQEVMAELFGRATGATKGEERVCCQEQGMLGILEGATGGSVQEVMTELFVVRPVRVPGAEGILMPGW